MKVALKDLVAELDKDVSKILSTNFRKELDARVAVLDLSYSTLKAQNYGEHFDSTYSTLAQVLSEKLASRTYASLEDIPPRYFSKPGAPVVLVDSGSNVKFILASSTGTARTFITDNVSKDPRLIDSIFGIQNIHKDVLNKKGIPTGDVVTTTRSKLDIGHLSTPNSDYMTSPAETKLGALIDHFTFKGLNKAVNIVERYLEELHSIQGTMQVSFKNSTPEYFNKVETSLGRIYIVMTIQPQSVNNEFALKEANVFNKLRAELALLGVSKLAIKSMNISGSNSIMEDITQGISQALLGKKGSLGKHNTQKITKQISVKPKNAPANANTFKVAVKAKATPAINVSPSSLQLLINSQLQDVISANMGDGDSKSILNYRTGRFASSAQVERLTQSREGMITAFYRYMKNPYATFSEGGRQQTPRSRDPKLLISKSIREIAATIVANRLRAVAV